MSAQTQAPAVLHFWFDDLEPKDWFEKNTAVDATITTKFATLYAALAPGLSPEWESSPRLALAAVITLDQFPRNMFRDSPRAFATDELALSAAKRAIDRGEGAQLNETERQFLYMPFQHAENREDQARSVVLFSEFDEKTLGFARRHQEIVDRFGRFPHRNAVLGRESTPQELEFLQQPNSSF